jgi:hypothetical protein
MARVLHLLKGDEAGLALEVIGQQHAAGDHVGVVLLPGAAPLSVPDGVVAQRVPDDLSWEALLERLFEAEQVIAW